MKYSLSLSLLAVLTACSSSKKSDETQTPGNDAPIASLDSNVGKIKTPADDIVIVTPADSTIKKDADNKNNDKPKDDKATETTPVPAVDPAVEAVKPVPETFVGFGYNSVQGEVKENCLAGDVVLDTSNSASAVSFARYSTYEDFKVAALGHQSGSILNAWAGVNFQNTFFAEFSAESLQANYVFASAAINGTKRMTNAALNVGSLTPNAFHAKCGNKYINSAVVGGAFIASVNLKFVNLDAKVEFGSEQFSFKKLSEVLTAEARLAADQRRVAAVEITYAQVGGGGATNPGLSASDLLSCSLENEETLEKCNSTLEKLAAYAISSEFQKAVKDYPAVYSFTTNTYSK